MAIQNTTPAVCGGAGPAFQSDECGFHDDRFSFQQLTHQLFERCVPYFLRLEGLICISARCLIDKGEFIHVEKQTAVIFQAVFFGVGLQ